MRTAGGRSFALVVCDVAYFPRAGAAEGFSFISTAGGAFLEWMEGKALPGVEVLRRVG